MLAAQLLFVVVPSLSPEILQAPETVYLVTDHGAKGDGVTYDTAAIQKAVDRASAGGGGIVRVPAGRFLTRRLQLRSGVTLHLAEGAELLGPSTPAVSGGPSPLAPWTARG